MNEPLVGRVVTRSLDSVDLAFIQLGISLTLLVNLSTKPVLLASLIAYFSLNHGASSAL